MLTNLHNPLCFHPIHSNKADEIKLGKLFWCDTERGFVGGNSQN